MPPKPRNHADDGHGHNGGGASGAGVAAGGAHSSSSANGAHSSHAAASTANGGSSKGRRAAAASNASASAATAAAVAAAHQQSLLQQAVPAVVLPTLQWADFERGVLHAYTRAFHLDEPSSFSNDFARWILSQPGSIGLQSPTMLRRKEARRQSKARLATQVRKHFNGQGGQENDIVVDFLHKIQTHEVARQRRPRRMGSNAREIDG
ncbi:hypothetical protein SPBR_06134 [Sporothrix brasiliensis 5110]|uniref:Histone deacetylase complex subunit SAP30 Sin3 binding domain-containing protein n=1 Tax=Sporothrix brasiliensis 5110 TaxID=1398154 RepID=A0A0C2IXW2_9PEZI|nr:uncharacterized protein SPBR_06134 [Sporothrix brasiliensis 5110]KIH93961.1 hypothetical protein SPBR_06134 [Sporothrix brasiliensis 5110]